jgi:hypothetical protein
MKFFVLILLLPVFAYSDEDLCRLPACQCRDNVIEPGSTNKNVQITNSLFSLLENVKITFAHTKFKLYEKSKTKVNTFMLKPSIPYVKAESYSLAAYGICKVIHNYFCLFDSGTNFDAVLDIKFISDNCKCQNYNCKCKKYKFMLISISLEAKQYFGNRFIKLNNKICEFIQKSFEK